MGNSIDKIMDIIGMQAKAAAVRLAHASPEQKEQALMLAADAIQRRSGEIIAANAEDLAFGQNRGLSDPMMDRLMLNADRVKGICAAIRDVAKQQEPVGRVLDEWKRKNGLDIRKVTTPLGVIGVVYESRPNVTADAGALALKSGNAVILRGGSESFHSSKAIYACLIDGIKGADLPEACIQLVPTRDREAVQKLLRMAEYVDVIVPRGGKRLVELVQKEARVPVFAHLEGIVHIYVDKFADPTKTLDVVLNSKIRRSSICGAAECLLVHRDIADGLGAQVIEALSAKGVQVRAGEGLDHIPLTVKALETDWGKEFLDNIISARIVAGVDEAIEFIQTYGSHHTDCIMTEDDWARERFFERVDSAILMHNASTQFADGGEFGMGGEIGIATGKLHARGPIGAEQLTSFKYLVRGNGATRV